MACDYHARWAAHFRKKQSKSELCSCTAPPHSHPLNALLSHVACYFQGVAGAILQYLVIGSVYSCSFLKHHIVGPQLTYLIYIVN